MFSIPTAAEDAWIVKHCRKDKIENVGHRPDLYERWLAGRSREVEDFKANFVDIKNEEKRTTEDLLKRTPKLAL